MIRRRHPIRFRSEKTKARADDRAAVVEAALRRDGFACAARARIGGNCSGPLDAHEIIPRSAWPEGQYELANVVTICRSHHRWVDAHPAAAHDLGLHGFSWERPS